MTLTFVLLTLVLIFEHSGDYLYQVISKSIHVYTNI